MVDLSIVTLVYQSPNQDFIIFVPLEFWVSCTNWEWMLPAIKRGVLEHHSSIFHMLFPVKTSMYNFSFPLKHTSINIYDQNPHIGDIDYKWIDLLYYRYKTMINYIKWRSFPCVRPPFLGDFHGFSRLRCLIPLAPWLRDRGSCRIFRPWPPYWRVRWWGCSRGSSQCQLLGLSKMLGKWEHWRSFFGIAMFVGFTILYIYTQIFLYTHTYTYTYTYTCTCSCTCTCIHPSIHPSMHACMCMHVHAYIHT